MVDMDDDAPLRMQLILALALVSIVVGGSLDLLLDQPQTWFSFHVIFEASMVAGALLIALTLWLGWWRAEKSVRALTTTLAGKQAERDAWKESAHNALAGLAAAIDRQFDSWQLTPAEREVALLLLKGYSHKHIARVTDRSERTARQHAVSVYEKAGLNSRAELSAYFLDDLLLPRDARQVV